MSNVEKLLYCNFCGKHQRQVELMITGVGCSICDECVALCVDILEEKRSEKLGDPCAPDAVGETK